MRRRVWSAFLAVALAVLGTAGVAACGGNESREAREPETYSFVIPNGTNSRIRLGEQLDVMPKLVVLHVGDTLHIRNEDRIGIDIGPYYVKGNSEMRLTYGAPGTFEGACSLTDSGTFTVQVLE